MRFNRLILLTFIFILFSVSSYAQILSVKDAMDSTDIEYVSVISEKDNFISHTNAKGNINISPIAGSDSIIIHFVGYEKLQFSYNELKQMGFTVYINRQNTEMDEIVISSKKWNEKSSEVSSRINVITPREAQFQNPQTSADLVGLSGEVYIQKSQLGGGSPMIRGFAANRVLISYDGIRMNNAIFRSGNLQNIISIDPFNIDQVEIDHGPGSVIYGSDAIGGVMNFQSPTLIYSFDTSYYSDSKAAMRYSSANSESTGHLSFRLGTKRFASSTSFTYSNFNDLRMGSNGPDEYLRKQFVTEGFAGDKIANNPDPELQVGTGYRQLNINQKLGYKVTEKSGFEYAFGYSTTSDIPRYDRLNLYGNNDSLRYARWHYGPQVWMINKLQFNCMNPTFFHDELNVIIARQDFEESREIRSFNDTLGSVNTEKLIAYSFNLDVKKNLSSRNTFFYGLEAIRNDVTSRVDFLRNPLQNADPSELTTRYPDGANWSSYAAYVNLKSKIGSKLNWQNAVRYNIIDINAVLDSVNFVAPVDEIQLTTSALTGSTGLVFQLNDRTILSTNLSTAFRAPNIDDVAKVFDSEPGAVIVPNENLKSEYAYSADIGLKKNFENTVTIKLNGFYTYLDNAMVRRNFLLNGQDSINYLGTRSNVQAIQNAAYAEVYGIQLALNLRMGDYFSLNINYTIQDGEEELDDGSKSAVRHVPPNFGRAELIFERRKLRVSVYSIYNSELSYNNLAVSERNKEHLYARDELGRPYSPEWYTFNFKSSYKIGSGINIGLGLENITDVRYRTYSSGITAAGRNLVVSVNAKF